MKITHWLLVFCVLLSCSGCDEIEQAFEDTPKAKPTTKQVAKKTKPAAKPLENAQIRDSSVYQSRPAFTSAANVGPAGYAKSKVNNEAEAMKKVSAVVEQSLEVGPTQIVWVVDRSESNSKQAVGAIASAKAMYDIEPMASAAKDNKLFTSVVGYCEKTEFLTESPISEVAKVKEALDAIKTEPGSRETTFTTLKMVLEQCIPARQKERREVVIVLVTDEPGDDASVALDDVVGLSQKYQIPIYILGPSVPLGKIPDKAKAMAASGGDIRTYSADVYRDDMVTMAFWGGGFAGGGMNGDGGDGGRYGSFVPSGNDKRDRGYDNIPSTAAPKASGGGFRGGYDSVEGCDSGLGPWLLEKVKLKF